MVDLGGLLVDPDTVADRISQASVAVHTPSVGKHVEPETATWAAHTADVASCGGKTFEKKGGGECRALMFNQRI